MASAVVMMIAGAVLNATAFSGSMYLVNTLSSKKDVDEEKMRLMENQRNLERSNLP